MFTAGAGRGQGCYKKLPDVFTRHLSFVLSLSAFSLGLLVVNGPLRSATFRTHVAIVTGAGQGLFTPHPFVTGSLNIKEYLSNRQEACVPYAGTHR